MRAILDAHPALAIPGESYFPLWFAQRRRYYERNQRFDTSAFVTDLVAHSWFRRWDLPGSQVLQAMAEAEPSTYPDAVRQLYSLYARQRGKRRYGDKTPTFVLHIRQLAALFPEATFIHVVRDGRDVALSLLEKSWGPTTISDAALHWRLHVHRGMQAGRHLERGRYHEIRYEDLVEDPESGARTLCRIVAVDYDPAMLRYFERADLLLHGLPDAAAHRNVLLPPTKGVRDWRSAMDEHDVARFEVLAGRVLDQFGYERTAQPRSTRAQLQGGLFRTRWSTRRRVRQLRGLAVGLALPDRR